MIASLHFDLDDARALRAHLAAPDAELGVERSERILAMLDASIAKGEVTKAKIDAEVAQFVELVIPLLDEARERGTYVGEKHRAYDDAVMLPSEAESGPHWWAQVDEEKLSSPVQMVVYSKPTGGANVVGYRWRPEGDERKAIELAELRRENDRCIHCGHLRVECEKVPNTRCRQRPGPLGTMPPHEF